MSEAPHAALRPLLQARLARTLAHLAETLPAELPLLELLTVALEMPQGTSWPDTAAPLARLRPADALAMIEADGPEIIAATLAELERWSVLLPEPVRLAVLRRAAKPGPGGRPPIPWSPGPEPRGALLLAILLSREPPPWEVSVLRANMPRKLVPLVCWLAERWELQRPELQRPDPKRPEHVALALALYLAEREERPELLAWETMAALANGEKAGDPAEVHRALAAELAGGGAEHEGRRAALARGLLAHLRTFWRQHMAGPTPVGAEACRELPDAPGLLWPDELAARFVGKMGEPGGELAATIRDNATKRWAEAFGAIIPGVDRPPAGALWYLWQAPGAGSVPRFARSLARCLWARMEVEREAERLRLERLGRPALPRVLVLGFSAALKGGKTIAASPVAIADPLHAEPVGAVSLLEDWQAALTSRTGLLPTLLAGEVLRALDTVAAARLPRLIAGTVNRYRQEGRSPQTLEWLRGLEGLAAALRLTSEERRALPAALDAFRVIHLPLPDGSTQHGLWTWNLLPGAPGRHAVLRLELPVCWIPGYAAMLKARGLGRPEDRRLVYLSAPEHIARPVARGRARPGEERLVLVVHREFADRSRELAALGGLDVSEAEWRRWADEARIARRGGLLERIRQGWLNPRQQPFWPMFSTLPNGLLRLADDEVHLALVDQGTSRNRRSAAGKKPRGSAGKKPRRKKKEPR